MCSSWVYSMIHEGNLLIHSESSMLCSFIYGAATELNSKDSYNPYCWICKWRGKWVGSHSHQTILEKKGVSCNILISWALEFELQCFLTSLQTLTRVRERNPKSFVVEKCLLPSSPSPATKAGTDIGWNFFLKKMWTCSRQLQIYNWIKGCETLSQVLFRSHRGMVPVPAVSSVPKTGIRIFSRSPMLSDW